MRCNGIYIYSRCEKFTYVNDNGIKLFPVTETWISVHSDDMKTDELVPNELDMKSFQRQSRSRGGGIATICKSDLDSIFTFNTIFDLTHTPIKL